jgi:lipoprotein NlpD
VRARPSRRRWPSPRGPLPGAENAGKPGYYTVRQGDTLIRIALETWAELARHRALEQHRQPERHRSRAGAARHAARRSRRGAARCRPPVAVAPVAPASAPAAGLQRLAADGCCQHAAREPRRHGRAGLGTGVAASQPASPDDNVGWGWPARQHVGAGDVRRSQEQGLDIAGKAGDPVLAAADGRVVYAGAGLRGYGNLIILKHNNTYLTAYAHNQTLLVKEDQSVRKGQKIAEMGSSDADRVKLHFEIRRQGKPVDPVAFLPR